MLLVYPRPNLYCNMDNRKTGSIIHACNKSDCCKKLFQNVDIVLLFATKSVRVGILPAQGKLVLRQVT